MALRHGNAVNLLPAVRTKQSNHFFTYKFFLMPGIKNSYLKIANQLFTSNITPASIGLASPIAASQRQHIKYWVPVTVGATGGLRAQILVPAGGTAFIASITLNNTVAPAQVIASQTSSAAFTNALANAGTHWLEIEVSVLNGTTAGTVDLVMAQNTSDALSLTVLAGANALAQIV